MNHQSGCTHPLKRLRIFLAPGLTKRLDGAAHEALRPETIDVSLTKLHT
jgi:hypothetical protein